MNYPFKKPILVVICVSHLAKFSSVQEGMIPAKRAFAASKILRQEFQQFLSTLILSSPRTIVSRMLHENYRV